MPNYYITYGVMGREAGANPFNHAFLLLSRQLETNGPIEVIDSVGYYSVTSTTYEPCAKALKDLVGNHFDLQNAHGYFKQEAMRDLDGKGLTGISFSVTEAQFNAVYQNPTPPLGLLPRIQAEQAAIRLLDAELLKERRPANGPNRFRLATDRLKSLRSKENPTVEDSTWIANLSALEPFQLEINYSFSGLDTQKSITCKTMLLKLLREHGIINESIANQLHGGRVSYAFPFASALPLFPIRLLSTGEPTRIKSKSKEDVVYYNRQWPVACDLLLMETVPTKTTLDTLPIQSMTAYIRVHNQQRNALYYIDKNGGNIWEIPFDETLAEVFDRDFMPSPLAKTLSLDEIKSINSKLDTPRPSVSSNPNQLHWLFPPVVHANSAPPHESPCNQIYEALIELRGAENKLRKMLDGSINDIEKGTLHVHIDRIETFKKNLIKHPINPNDRAELNDKLKDVTEYLDVARMALAPPKTISAHFAIRLSTYVGMRHVLLGLAALIAAAVFLGTTPMGMTIMLGCSAMIGFNTYRLYQTESNLSRARYHHNAFLNPRAEALDYANEQRALAATRG